METPDCVVRHGEVAGPVCAPSFAVTHRETLTKPVDAWGALTFLDLATPNLGWTSWNDWFRVAGRPQPAPRLRGFDSYGYLLHATVRGQGVAMARQPYIDRHVQAGRLVPLAGGFVDFDKRFCGRLTARGRGKSSARKRLSFLEDATWRRRRGTRRPADLGPPRRGRRTHARPRCCRPPPPPSDPGGDVPAP